MLVLSEAELSVFKAYIREEVEAVLAERSGQPKPLVMTQGDPVDIDLIIGDNRISLRRLIHIFENCSMHAGFIYDQLRKENAVPEDVNYQIALVGSRHSAMRKAVTMRDSCDQMARLLKGENLDLDEEEPDDGRS